jgi:CheY-like chemotaxis protein
MNQEHLKCVLLVDDDEPTNFLSKMIIEQAGCTDHIQVEDSAERALQYLVESSKRDYAPPAHSWPDLIFLDINMPAMNGWEFLEQYENLKKKHERNVIIIMLTTSLNPGDEKKACKSCAVTEFRQKPLTKEILDEILSKHFPK